MKKLLFSLFAILAFVACSDDGTGAEESTEIKLETTEANIESNENSTVINFFAAEPWTAEVTSTRAIDWCTVSPTSGEAGEATITVTTTTNDSSKVRLAKVVIKSGETEKAIEVKQEESHKRYEILYTSSDGKIINVSPNGFGADIISNTYENGQGVVTFSNSVTSIPIWAFGRDGSTLTSIAIPDSVTSIEQQAFQGCSNLTSVTIRNGVTSIGDIAFSGCSSLTSITIPDSVTSIGVQAFSGCSSLTNITIPDSITSIAGSTFNGCI